MNLYTYDFEVFKYDWLVVFKNYETKEYTIIVNSNAKFQEFIDSQQPLIAGFNSKSYDDYIAKAIYHGADNRMVKKLNDHIISGLNGWQFSFLQYKRKIADSFDVRLDLPKDLSLKEIEGNMMVNIVESSIPFDIDRKLTEDEIQETIKYCKHDVDNTEKILDERIDYFEAKKTVARIKGVNELEYLRLTNAQMTAKFLDAKKVKRDDEFYYEFKGNVDIAKYTEVFDFFHDPIEYERKRLTEELQQCENTRKQKTLTNKLVKLDNAIPYDVALEIIIAGVVHTVGWGGIHGARKNYIGRTTKGTKLVMVDVGAYYASLIIKYDLASRNIKNINAYKDTYNMRMEAKHSGEKEVAEALKLILNTFFGASKSQYSDLYDPLQANQICLYGMTYLIDLIEKLEPIRTLELIQSNTDGILIEYDNEDEQEVFEAISEWEHRTGMNMEYTIINRIAQKDVNNYVCETGESFMIKKGEKVVLSTDTSIKSKGGWFALHEGGTFKKNSMSIVAKALVQNIMNDVPIEQTINDCDDIFAFQIIAKTGSTFKSTWHEINGEKVQVQKVNRVYATTNERYGLIYKYKEEKDSYNAIADLPDHCIIDNDNQLTIDDIDKQFYIDLAHKRLKLIIGGKKTMAKSETTKATEVVKMNIYQKMALARKLFAEKEVKKSGKNMHMSYKYFELEDIVPLATEAFDEARLLPVPTIDNGVAILTVHNIDNVEERIYYHTPFVYDDGSFNNKITVIQHVGSSITYVRRYLYMLAFDIIEKDELEEKTGKKEDKPKADKKAKPTTKEERTEVKENLTAGDKEATKTQIKSVTKGLKKLKDIADAKDIKYIAKVAKAVKAGVTKKECETYLVEISEKIDAYDEK